MSKNMAEVFRYAISLKQTTRHVVFNNNIRRGKDHQKRSMGDTSKLLNLLIGSWFMIKFINMTIVI